MCPMKYTLYELRAIAKSRSVPKWSYMNKGQLCEALSIVRVEHLPKYSLTCLETFEVTKWRSTTAISRAFKTDPGNVLYALKTQRPLKVQTGLYHVHQLRW